MHSRPSHVRTGIGWIAISLMLVLVLSSCDQQEEPLQEIDYEAEGLDTPLSAEQLEEISDIPAGTLDLDEIILPNGRTVADFLDEYGFLDEGTASAQPLSYSIGGYGPQTQKNLIIGRMTQLGRELTDRSVYHPEEPPQNGVERPEQRGLGYSFGGKDHTRRLVPPPIDGYPDAALCRDAAIYGIDCSGFIYQLARAAGIDIPVGTANTQRMPATWNEALADEGLTRLRAEDLGQLDPSEFETGDIIYWFGDRSRPSNATHIGIILENEKGVLELFHSPGYPGNELFPPPGLYPPDACEQNYGPKWGPQQTSLDDTYWFSGRGGDWGVVRIVTDISGDWLLYGRCQDQTTDAFALTLTFVSEADQDVAASGSGTDYDGDPLLVELEGTYLQATNTLSADINFSFPDTGGSRIDTFERRLNEDDTGYFPATLVYHSTSGCDLAVRLVNQETAPPPARQSASSPSGGTGLISD